MGLKERNMLGNGPLSAMGIEAGGPVLWSNLFPEVIPVVQSSSPVQCSSPVNGYTRCPVGEHVVWSTTQLLLMIQLLLTLVTLQCNSGVGKLCAYS